MNSAANVNTTGNTFGLVGQAFVKAFPLTLPFPISLRFKLLFCGVIVPLGCVIASLCGLQTSIDQPWQTGDGQYYSALFLQWPAVAPMLPFVLLSMVSLAFWLIRTEAGHQLWVRFGILVGNLLALHFLILFIQSLSIIPFVAAAFVIPILFVLVFVAGVVVRRIPRFTIFHLLVLTTVIAITIVVLQTTDLGSTVLRIAPAGLLFCLLSAPLLTMSAFMRATLAVYYQAKLDQRVETGTSKKIRFVAFSIAWLLSYLAAWKIAVELMLIEYEKLPTSDPNCYVASAAAYGHPGLVGATEHGGGKVNLQMQRLKFLELSMAAICPGFVCCVRKPYNIHGPALAKFCRSSAWFADATFVMVKPVEWLALLMQCCLRIDSRLIRKLYR